MGLSTSVFGTLGDLVVVHVVFVGTWVASDGNGQGGSTGKGEDKVHEVQDCQEDWRCQEGNKEGNHTVEGGGQDTPSTDEDTVIDLWVVVCDGGCCQRGGQTERNRQEHEVDNSKSNITVREHCVYVLCVSVDIVIG